MVPPELWDTAAPGGWESTGPQVRRTGSSERVSAYLASLGVPEPYPILGSGLRKQGALQQLGRKVAEVEVGSVSGSAAPLSPVSESSLFSALYAHLFLFHPLNGMFHLPWKPGGRGKGWSPCSGKAFFFRDWHLWDSTRYCCRRQVEEGGEGNSRGGPSEDKTGSNSSPLP